MSNQLRVHESTHSAFPALERPKSLNDSVDAAALRNKVFDSIELMAQALYSKARPEDDLYGGFSHLCGMINLASLTGIISPLSSGSGNLDQNSDEAALNRFLLELHVAAKHGATLG